MRCLYCSKELALLKRWTGGGEFCSDAHRQLYQEEYNKLALNHLLQAQPSGEKNVKKDAKAAEPEIRTTSKAAPAPKSEPVKSEPAKPQVVKQAPVKSEPARPEPRRAEPKPQLP